MCTLEHAMRGARQGRRSRAMVFNAMTTRAAFLVATLCVPQSLAAERLCSNIHSYKPDHSYV